MRIRTGMWFGKTALTSVNPTEITSSVQRRGVTPFFILHLLVFAKHRLQVGSDHGFQLGNDLAINIWSITGQRKQRLDRSDTDLTRAQGGSLVRLRVTPGEDPGRFPGQGLCEILMDARETGITLRLEPERLEAWVRLMVLDKRIKDVIDELRQRHLDQFIRQDSLKKHAQIFTELLAQTLSNRLLVGEKVIQRANRRMRLLCNHVRRRGIKADLIEHLGSRL